MALKLLSHTEQVADHLRSELLRGRWTGHMPGAMSLQAELGTSHNTVDLALKQLEAEGLLIPQGSGKPRLIVLPEGHKPPGLRISILLYDADDRQIHYVVEILHQLQKAGHTVSFSSKTLTEMGMNVRPVANYVKANPADAWIVLSGSESVLRWFESQPFPVFGLFGHMAEVPIAGTGPSKSPTIIEVTRKLVALGHRRIVMLTREERRKPVPGIPEQMFLNELKALGIKTGPYNIPDWKETPDGFQLLFDALFKHTPPTAMLLEGVPIVFGTLQQFCRRKISVPEDISIIALDADPAFHWSMPPISHIRYDSKPWIRRIVRWAHNVAHGKDDRGNGYSPAEFVEGGSIGPVKK
jgi:DNA-binding LacI/PurR family transcriptional regulator